MQMESQVPTDCEACIQHENLGRKDGNSGEPSSSQDNISLQQPVKKRPRQWAAWTRQEEESFFSALRLVGKNFEKITCHVQSKNKDQVRHYYYRLVRRMNKLLGPELCLDAKNSKDTNAAMLRWWSLLEKYSCKASKLHLKPRRFKIFVEALENQLLKDRKKNLRKRLSPGENNCSTAPITVSNPVRPSSHDSRAVKLVLVDSQNMQKVGPGKGSLVKRNVNLGTDRTNSKVDSSSLKTAKHRRKTGSSTAAYKRWEKAAIAGVSLVADAAEHLERTITEKEVAQEVECVHETRADGGSQPAGKVELSLPMSSQSLSNEYNAQNSMKLKLQLFPIDDCTRKSLEADNYNPHLELTLGSRKKISSVLDHLNRKWGNSNLLSGDLMLFPYWAHCENLVGCQKWTKDSQVCAADVYAKVGSPQVFRLRYGWFAKAELESAIPQALQSYADVSEKNSINSMKEHNIESVTASSPTYHKSGDPRGGTCQELLASADKMTSMTPSSTFVSKDEIIKCDRLDPNINSSRHIESTPAVSVVRRETGALADIRQVESMDDWSKQKDLVLSAGEWADSLTCISMGDLLSDSMLNVDANCADLPLPVGSSSLQQIPFSCDSFDTAIAAHIYKHQNKVGSQLGLAPHAPSIWDAEETCDAFAFQKSGAFCEVGHSDIRNASLQTCAQIIRTSSSVSQNAVELTEDKKSNNDDPTYGEPMDTLENSAKDFSGLTDTYWPDSLGPLDLDIPSCRLHSDDIILSDSIGGLNRFLANSLDAFQNCSFFGLDKKESASAVEGRQTASVSDFKISG
ncbi:TSL-kinase interacting 1 [Olea europaea subsp. europaea]|uniref:TSL-kinase interacting 1 n=1 Tax=Olea europaea subsp. europaea TaxID=158383 RepID=A0A8S0RHT2_OLEEU|nr:TSL-kinase interacting 1 [Olea europaea subsp. europaea]